MEETGDLKHEYNVMINLDKNEFNDPTPLTRMRTP